MSLRNSFPVKQSLLAVYFLLAFTQELPTTALYIVLVNNMSLDPQQVVAFYAMVFLPWSFKPVYALFSDRVPIFHYRRRPYIFFSCICYSLCFLLLGIGRHTVPMVFGISIVQSVFACFCEVVVDSVAVEIINNNMRVRNTTEIEDMRRHFAHKVQSACMAARSCGSLVSSAIAILALRYLSASMVLGITSIFPIFVIVAASCIEEKQVFDCCCGIIWDCNEFKVKLRFVRSVLAKMLVPFIFLFIYNAVPNTLDTYSTFVISAFSFQDWQLALLKFAGLLSSLAGVLAYWYFLPLFSLRSVFVVTSFAAIAASSTQVMLAARKNESMLHIPDFWFALLDKTIDGFFTRMSFMPTLVLAAQNCPRGAEGTVYSLFSSSGHLASLLSSLLSAQMVMSLHISNKDWTNLWKMIVICDGIRLIPIMLATALLPSSISEPSPLAEVIPFAKTSGCSGQNLSPTSASAIPLESYDDSETVGLL